IVSFATGGHMFLSGKMGQPPLKYQGYKAQLLAGAHAATATLGAVMAGVIHGEGQWVDVSIQEAQMGPAEEAQRLVRYAYLETDEGERVSARRMPGMVAGVFFCADGYVQITSANPAWWGRIASMMDMPELTTDPRFALLADRRENWEEFEPMFYTWLATHTMVEITTAAQANRIPAVPVYTVDQVPNDPQLQSRSYFVTLDHPAAGSAVYPGAPFKMAETPYAISRAPLLGEQNAAILGGELGRSGDELAQLKAQGII
ncbi:MAG: CoA transferase, partial [Chloroflexi bacterium]|nr:CoA transferase [Chloroflexota bacterium]